MTFLLLLGLFAHHLHANKYVQDSLWILGLLSMVLTEFVLLSPRHLSLWIASTLNFISMYSTAFSTYSYI